MVLAKNDDHTIVTIETDPESTEEEEQSSTEYETASATTESNASHSTIQQSNTIESKLTIFNVNSKPSSINSLTKLDSIVSNFSTIYQINKHLYDNGGVAAFMGKRASRSKSNTSFNFIFDSDGTDWFDIQIGVQEYNSNSDFGIPKPGSVGIEIYTMINIIKL